ncbi:MAG: sensor histidine kinase, partial [Acidobacteria bacterium]|nr:sensor histidine kinase [Acidobacteriota bacterium]
EVAPADGGIRLSVSDDGVGFAVAARSPEGLGIVGMQERVRLAGGRFELASRIGAGSRVTVWAPLPVGGAGGEGGAGDEDGEATAGAAGG